MSYDAANDFTTNVFRVTNNGTTTFHDAYDGQTFTCAPGMELLAPFEAVCLWTGNWQARDTARYPRRTNEISRLMIRVGAYDNDEIFHERKPSLEVHTMSGEKIYTVLEDPTGEHMGEASYGGSDPFQLLKAAHAEKDRELEAIRTRLEELERNKGMEITPDEDTPRKAKAPARAG